MTTEVAKAPAGQKAEWPDARLVCQCRKGKQDTWSALVGKHKDLIFSTPIKYGCSEILQGACLELLRDLLALGERRTLAKGLIRVTSHKCSYRKQQEQRCLSGEKADAKLASLFTASKNRENALREAEPEQLLRQALSAPSSRCRQLIHMLFLKAPARPYQEIAECLGVAAGPIGYIRGRCLEQLHRQWTKAELR